MTISLVSPSSLQSAESIKSSNANSRVDSGFTINRNLTQADVVSTGAAAQAPALSSDTVSISAAARIQSSATAVSPGAIPALTSMAIPSWMGSYAQRLPQLGESASEWASSGKNFDALSGSERAQYSQLLDQHYQSLLADNGLKNNPDSYTLLVKNKDTSEQFRQDFEKRIAADTTLTALLAKMNGQA